MVSRMNNYKLSRHDIIILAMKPKDAEDAIQSIAPLLQPDQLIVSVIAGLQTSYIEGLLPSGQQVIRVMPNTSSMIGESATALSSGKHTTQQNMEMAKELFQCIGEVFIIAEDKMDIFTGIAGSGPAYLYYLMEHMEKVGTGAGFPEKATREIIAQTYPWCSKNGSRTGAYTNHSQKKCYFTKWNNSSRITSIIRTWWWKSNLRSY